MSLVSLSRSFLRLENDTILLEQSRRVLNRVSKSLLTTVLLVLMLFFALRNDANAQVLTGWSLALLCSRLINWLHARWYLARELAPNRAVRQVIELIVLNALDGALWGSLAWVVLGTASASETALVIGVLIGVSANASGMLSAVVPVYVVMSCAKVGLSSSKLFLMHDLGYSILGVAALLNLGMMLAQAFQNSRNTRNSIKLRLKNNELVKQLLMEKDAADQARREAEQANSAKSRFLAAASHDLRQPIHAQGLFLEVLSKTQLSDQQAELLTNVRAASDSSAKMLGALLDLSRIEAGVVDPQVQAFPVQPLLNRIEKEFAQQADIKGLSYRSRETRLVVLSDQTLLELILRNLVSNAIRYTEKGGLLVVCRQRESQAWLEVWDTGVGIAESHQDEIFLEFHQLGNPERDHLKGLGLGLAIVHGLVQALGLRITLYSKVNRGSVFSVAIPLGDAQAVPKVQPPRNAQISLGIHVLVIDDEPFVRAGMLQLLTGWGCTAEAAESIEEALVLVENCRPDLIISDHRLREQFTGIQAIAAVRHRLAADVPALLITGDTGPDRLQEALASGGIPVLHKPVSPSQLHQAMVRVLEG